jgi:hypothetical protein
VRIPREAWKLDRGGEASHGYGTSVKVLVRASRELWTLLLSTRLTGPDVGVTLVDERVDRFRCSRWLSREL